MKKYALAILILFCSLLNRANDFRLDKIQIEDGLTQSDVTSIVQDRNGFIWFATNNGLNQYDGYRIKQFKHTPGLKNQLIDNKINTMELDSQNNIWIGAKTGLCCYNISSNKFVVINDVLRNNNYEPIRDVSQIFHSSENQIWAIIDNQICRLDETQQFFIAQDIQQNDYNIGRINQVLENTSLKQLILATTRGVWVYDASKNTVSPIILTTASHCRYDPSTNGYYIADADGLTYIQKEKNIKEEILYNGANIQHIRALFKDSENRIWIGTKDNGIFIRDENGIVQFTHNPSNPNSISSNEIRYIYEDSSKVVWVGTTTGGVNKFVSDYSLFNTLRVNPYTENRGLSDKVVKSVYIENNNKVWIGTKEGVLNLWDRKNNKLFYYKNTHTFYINDIEQSTDENFLWIGGTYGLYRFNKKTGQFKHFPSATKNGNLYVNTLFMDFDSTLWYGSPTGLFALKNDKITARLSGTDKFGISNKCRFIYRKNKNAKLWIGFQEKGVAEAVMKDGEISLKMFSHVAGDSASINFNDISCMLEDSKGRLWFGTWGRGINLLTDYNTGTFKHFTTKNGLSDNIVFGMYEDKSGQLWISTYNGLSKFNPATESFTNYTYLDGLQSNEFSVGAHAQSKKGELFFGGINGLNYFFPENVKQTKEQYPLAITRMRIYSDEVNVDTEYNNRIILDKAIFKKEKITLPYSIRSFSFDVSLFSYVEPERNQFKYTLEGFDNKWNTSIGNTSINYSNLSPGSYTLLIKGRTYNGKWNQEPLSLTIEIRPPFWASIWGYIIYAVVLAGIIYVLLLFYLKSQKQKQIILKNKLKDEAQKDMYNTRMRFYTNISHELRTPLSLILGLTNKIQKSSAGDTSKSIEIIKRNAEKLLTLINEILDFRKIETQNIKVEKKNREIVSFVRSIYVNFKDASEKSDITFHFESKIKSLMLDFDIEKTEKIIYNLLSNALKHTKNEINVVVATDETKDKRLISISVSDNGNGISVEEQNHIFTRFYQGISSTKHLGSGIGLNLSLELARLQEGNLKVQSDIGKGSRFTLFLPVQNVNSEIELGDQEENAENLPVVLVIDDNKDMCFYFEEILCDEYQVSKAYCGNDGLQIANEIMPDIIICDIMMPDMDGITLCKMFKESVKTNHIPVVLVSARSTDQYKIEGLQYGADAYLTKPFSEEHLKAQMESIFKTRDTMREKLKLELLSKPKEVEQDSPQNLLMRKIVESIEANIADCNYSVEQLSKDVALSRMHLTRKLNGIIGMSPGNFIRDFRLQRAADLLKNSDMNVSEVCYTVGFNTPKYFRAIFAKKFGVNPNEYQNSARLVTTSREQ
ncbi:hybrid sensor histidine kinase/response regulator transcription factor [Maribellus comscasis]|nr:hybrid sensor histidine kinase/response regulator transcription factor [Maribellus comscasis]